MRFFSEKGGFSSWAALVCEMAKNCCWNCKYYIAKGDNEPAFLSSARSNVCVYSSKKEDPGEWWERASPTPPNFVCKFYEERFY